MPRIWSLFRIDFERSDDHRTNIHKNFIVIVFCSSALHFTSALCSEIVAYYYGLHRKRGRSNDRRTSLGFTPPRGSVPRI